MDEIVVRGLTRDILVRSSESEVVRILQNVAAQPEVVGLDRPLMRLAVEQAGPGRAAVTFPTGEQVEGPVREVGWRIFHLALTLIETDEPGRPLLHAALLNVGGVTAALSGRKGAGKSTLAIHLLLNGAEVHGDEHVMVRDEDVVARPRLLHVKGSTLPLIPGLAARLAEGRRRGLSRRPVGPEDEGVDLWLVDPRLFGRPWVIRPTPIGRIFVIEPNHGGASHLEPLTPLAAFGHLAAECLLPAARSEALAHLWRLTQRTPAYRLHLGDLDQAGTLIGGSARDAKHVPSLDRG